VSARIHTYSHTHVYVHMQYACIACVHTSRARTRMHTCIYKHIHTKIHYFHCMYCMRTSCVCVCEYVCTWIYMYSCACGHVCIYVCVRAHTCMHTYIRCVDVYMNVYIYMYVLCCTGHLHTEHATVMCSRWDALFELRYTCVDIHVCQRMNISNRRVHMYV